MSMLRFTCSCPTYAFELTESELISVGRRSSRANPFNDARFSEEAVRRRLEIVRLLRSFFCQYLNWTLPEHNPACQYSFSRTVSQSTFHAALDELQTLQGDLARASIFTISTLFTLYPHQKEFWHQLRRRFSDKLAVQLYTLSLPLVPRSLRPKPTHSHTAADSAAKRRRIAPEVVEVADTRPPPPRPPPQPVQLPPLPRGRKCGFCRQPGHTVRDCAAPGINEHLLKKRGTKLGKKPPAPPVGPSMPKPLLDRLAANVKTLSTELHNYWTTIEYHTFAEPAAVRNTDDLEIVGTKSVHPTCPLGGQPLSHPVLGKDCKHTTQFFDLSSLLKYWLDCHMAKRPIEKWSKCPVCKALLDERTIRRSVRMEQQLKAFQQQSLNHTPPANIVVLD